VGGHADLGRTRSSPDEIGSAAPVDYSGKVALIPASPDLEAVRGRPTTHPITITKRRTMSGRSRPQSNSPWVIDTRALGRRPGTLRELRLAAPVDEPMGLDVVAVPPGAEVDLDLRLEAVAEGVLVSGTAAAVAVGQCSRCLIDLTEPVIARIRELYAYPESATAATTEDDEIARLVDDLVDLQPVVHDEVVLALPMAPLCRPDCPGLCAVCGERFDDLEPGHSHEILDPRWAALRDRLDTDSPESADRPAAGPVD